MAKNYSIELRRALKVSLIRERGAIHGGMIIAKCAYCNSYNSKAEYDMHEVIITRGHISGSVLQGKIMVRENCVLVHHGDCHIKAATRDGRKRCIEHLLKYEGYIKIKEWLLEMDSSLKSNLALDKLRLVKEIHYGN